jgi:acyl carrier protein
LSKAAISPRESPIGGIAFLGKGKYNRLCTIRFLRSGEDEAMKDPLTDDPTRTRDILRGFITEHFLSKAGLGSFSDEESFMEKGIIDSTGILELLEFIEGNFSIRVEDDEIIPENLDSLDKVASFIHRKTGHARL